MTPVRHLLKPYRSVLWFLELLPRRSLMRLRFCVTLICLLTGTITLYGLYTDTLSVLPWFGLTLLMCGLWLDLFLLYTYQNSFYFYGIDSVSGNSGKVSPGLRYIPADILIKNEQDVMAAFIHHPIGQEVLVRLGLSPQDGETFLTMSRIRITHDSLLFDENDEITLKTLGQKLYAEDATLRTWLLTHKINQAVWNDAVSLVDSIHLTALRRERWWSRDNLSRRQNLGQALAYGQHHFVSSLSRPFEHKAIVTHSHPVYDRYVETIGTALARDKASNILLLGTEGGGVIDVLARLKYQFLHGQQLRALHHPHLYEIDMDLFFSRYHTPELFTIQFERLLTEAAAAGNIILIFSHFSSMINRCKTLGIDLTTIIDDYLASSALHIIAVDTPHEYHTTLRDHSDLLRYFTEILIDQSDSAIQKTIVTDYILVAEPTYQTQFTVAAIDALITDAERYTTEGEMPDRAITLAANILAHAQRHKVALVTADTVHTFVSNLTNIPIGPISEAEKEKLLHLEDYLSQYIAGQPTAVQAIARTIRRARADIERHNKPIGSFLFLGPTGVGKTETAKALARLFFTDETRLTRFDMSEFSQREALARFIGTNDQVGDLTIALQNQPYTVLLLDEFEKAHRSVHDLFLQILDEGYFTTGTGERVHAETTIIIATSNAGSDLIARTFATRQTTPHLTTEVIRSITEQGIFRPELINRFDSTIVFEPLTPAARKQIVTTFLHQLLERLAGQGYIVQFDDSIVMLILEEGFDPIYGARPLQRYIQNLLEDYLAKAILENRLQPGQRFTLSADLFTPTEISAARG